LQKRRIKIKKIKRPKDIYFKGLKQIFIFGKLQKILRNNDKKSQKFVEKPFLYVIFFLNFYFASKTIINKKEKPCSKN